MKKIRLFPRLKSRRGTYDEKRNVCWFCNPSRHRGSTLPLSFLSCGGKQKRAALGQPLRLPSRRHRSLTGTSCRNPSSTMRILSSGLNLRRATRLTCRMKALVSSVRDSASNVFVISSDTPLSFPRHHCTASMKACPNPGCVHFNPELDTVPFR